MFSEPEYAQNVIVGVTFQHMFTWYVTEKDYWYLDYTKYDRALLASGYSKPIDNDEYAYRSGIAVLNGENAARFLAIIADKRISAKVLMDMMRVRKVGNAKDDLLDFAPCFLVDFDQKHFSSLYPEMIRFELYVPDGWIGTYKDFRDKIPEEERYWIVDGHDIFQQ